MVKKEFILLCLVSFSLVCMSRNVPLKMATTTSTESSGLLDCLLPKFTRATHIRMHVISVGTGKAIKLAENGDVDVILVHAKQAELKFIEEGYGVNRREVMYNDFMVLGPTKDPAHIKGRQDVVKAFKKIAEGEFTFVSRGDDSGTHKKEMSLWRAADIVPKGRWYLQTGQGMAPTLKVADEKQAYVLIDRATYLAFKDKIDLVPVLEGDNRFFNQYAIIAVNPAKYPHVQYKEAMKFINWITSRRAQNLIGRFRKHGTILFHSNAKNSR